MTDEAGGPGSAADEARRQRLKAALRANLLKRHALRRAQEAAGPPPVPAAGARPAGRDEGDS